MTWILIDVDDEALAAAAKALGTPTTVDTVNRALAEVAGRAARLAFLDHLRAGSDDFSDSEVIDAAWS